MSIIRTIVLSKTYRSGLFKRSEKEALCGVTLTVERGEVFGLLGPNGAGKTTLLKLLVSIIFPTGGAGFLFDRPLGDVNARQKIGFVPEIDRFPFQATGLQALVSFGLFRGLDRAKAKAHGIEMLRLVGLKGWEHVKLHKYSKGMLRRLNIAQALLHEPELLILDEPTDALDPVGRKEVRDILLELARRGTTIFLSSHLLSEVEALCQRVAVLDKGKVLTVASVEDIAGTSGEYEIHAEGSITPALIDQLGCTRTERQGENIVFRVKAQSTVELNKMVDLLRHNGILLRSLKPVRPSLEDAFINLVKRDSHHE